MKNNNQFYHLTLKSILSAVLLFVLFSNKSFSQDTIIKMNGDVILVKVKEITNSEVKYFRANMPDGPVYLVQKSEIKIIKYASGLSETFGSEKKENNPADYVPNQPRANASDKKIGFSDNVYVQNNRPINEYELHSILMETRDNQIMEYATKAKNNKIAQNVVFGTIPFAVGATICIPYWLLYSLNNSFGGSTQSQQNLYGALSVVCIAGCVACPVVSGVCKSNKRRNNEKAVMLYNQRY